MPLGDALYTITMSAGRSAVKTTADWTVSTTDAFDGGSAAANTMVKVDNMIYLTSVEFHTDIDVDNSTPHFLEMYLNNTDEGSFLWSMPVERQYSVIPAAGKPSRNFFHFFQPIRANEVYFLLRSGHPYPHSNGGTKVAIGGTSAKCLLTGMQTPRNFT